MSTEFPLIADLVAIESSGKLELCIIPENASEDDLSFSILKDITAEDVKLLISRLQYILNIDILI